MTTLVPSTVLPVSTDNEDPLHYAELEMRHLKDTLSVLREQLENKDFERSQAVQGAVQASFDETEQLKSTASSLRDELESLRFEKDAAVQQAVGRAHD